MLTVFDEVERQHDGEDERFRRAVENQRPVLPLPHRRDRGVVEQAVRRTQHLDVDDAAVPIDIRFEDHHAADTRGDGDVRIDRIDTARQRGRLSLTPCGGGDDGSGEPLRWASRHCPAGFAAPADDLAGTAPFCALGCAATPAARGADLLRDAAGAAAETGAEPDLEVTGPFVELGAAAGAPGLAAPAALLPDVVATAADDDSEIMGLRHRELPIHGVQFHPESILTQNGKQLLKNFLEMA